VTDGITRGKAGGAGLSTTAYRHCHPDFAEVSGATLEASAREGGRFNARSDFGALYVSQSEAAAVSELRRRANRLGIDVADLFPRTMLRLRLELTRVLDLCEPAIASAWGLTADRLRSDDLTPCQEVGRAARGDGYEAIRFPAATGAGNKVAVFLDRLRPGSTVVIEDRWEFDSDLRAAPTRA
jgi:RES domain-containing protein